MNDSVRRELAARLDGIRQAGTWKEERQLSSPQGATVRVSHPAPERRVLNFCANNYLGLANHPEVVAAAKRALDEFGFGLSSVRFICGTQTIHRRLESAIAEFLGTEDAVLYSSCFDANGGLFETLLDEGCAVISDQLNHASIIDGIRLCKARRLRYAHLDMNDLEARLRESADARIRLVATDGVFSMDGDVAPLQEICSLAERHEAMVMVDDSHATGVIGTGGRGSAEHCGVSRRVDILTGTLGKALGGATGGYVAARREVTELLRQRSRPYLFSNTLAPSAAAASLKCIEMLSTSDEALRRLAANAEFFRVGMTALGFRVRPGTHPIVPIMLGDAALARRFADALLDEGIYAIGFSYPVVPQGEARIRVQVSASHANEDLQAAVDAFARVGRALRVVP
jgi:glycine C-acetyltransferase